MSIAGIRSNRGDGYQTLVAFDWALTVLTDPDFQWIEVDSVLYYSVDDVVIGLADGSVICCQCKKNQPNFRYWTISNIAEELEKAFGLLSINKNATVCFYSRSPFSKLAKLREYAVTQSDEKSYRENFGIEHQEFDVELSESISRHSLNISSYEFLNRTSFETSPDFHRMEARLHERLRSIASNPEAAYNALWTRIDKLGERMDGSNTVSSPQHRLTKEDLINILQQAGAILAPSMNLAEVRSSFVGTSAIGRVWSRDIAGQKIDSPALKRLLEAVDAKTQSILLTGLPGSGKTCVMLALQDELELRAQTRTDIVPLFIQSREFADLATTQDRQAQGLSKKWVEKVSRMAEQAHVVIVIDSLDVLSIAREHSVLTYFLSQIDRLLLIPNITVVTACRGFDRHYDRRIAERQWGVELNCDPLNWEAEVIPLLNKIGIDIKTIDTVTRGLICNPRELALFVELAQREGSFNVVTSQALAQRYLDSIVRANHELGDTALKAIEAIASEMLNSRSLAVPHQRLATSKNIHRLLLSLNILQETQDGKLTFGHQTLLDVLVISGAVRQGVTLNNFIRSLPTVPFVRPSIRSFIMQLGAGERSEFRKQIRTVLTSSVAFNIRRLVAESFAEQVPVNDDWPLIRDLRNKHPEVFQVIYTQAIQIDWHCFWLKHLIPVLIETQDVNGLTAHVHRVRQWNNDDVEGVLKFWTDVISLDWFDGEKISDRLGHYLSEIDENKLSLVVPLLVKILSMPRQEHSLIGRAVARSVAAGVLKNTFLWSYIAGDITDECIIKYELDHKLRCEPHEFGSNNDDFINKQIEQSTDLLSLALESIERWGQIRSTQYGKPDGSYNSGFLNDTSHEDTHSRNDMHHVSSVRTLMDAIEAAILCHAEAHSKWWQNNRERLCFNHEGALRYFAILSVTSFPQSNMDLIGRVLCDKELLKSDLSYELGTLMQMTFIYLDSTIQDTVINCLLTLWDEFFNDESHHVWILKKRVVLIKAIPCFLRSYDTQAVLDRYEKKEGNLIRQPEILQTGGIVSAPFSFEIFLSVSDEGVLRLLSHYFNYASPFDDFLVGGEHEVGQQLSEAASRDPIRFLRLLSNYWSDISKAFRNNILNGAANYLQYRSDRRPTNGTWKPVDEPEVSVLTSLILDELGMHTKHWHHNRTASEALLCCAHVIQDTKDASRLVALSIAFESFQEAAVEMKAKDLINKGINMTVGHVAEALMITANRFLENGVAFPDGLPPSLRRFAAHEHPAIRALILRRLPYLQSQNSELGWELFERAVHSAAAGFWVSAERCLYHSYHNDFERITPLLERIKSEGSDEDMEAWGRIMALAALSNRTDFSAVLENLKCFKVAEAWEGASSVWTHPENINRNSEQCFTGIETALNDSSSSANIVAKKMEKIFRKNSPIIFVPIELIQKYFSILESDCEKKHHRLYGFSEWLNIISHRDPDQVIPIVEIYLSYIKRNLTHLDDYENHFTQLMTRLFAEAEEREESDQGEMLKRVVSIQDTLLSLGSDSINDWLKAAERP